MTQSQAILRDLKNGHKITQLDAIQLYGCTRLAARINDLRGLGYDIKTETITTPFGKRYARYSLAVDVVDHGGVQQVRMMI